MTRLPVPVHPPRAARLRVARILSAGLLLSLVAAPGTASASHSFGELDCGSAGTFEVDGRGPLPAGFDAPGPWSGLFLLEGTTRVFRALSIEGAAFPFGRPSSERFPGQVIECTLTSSGPMFPTPWTLEGVLVP